MKSKVVDPKEPKENVVESTDEDIYESLGRLEIWLTKTSRTTPKDTEMTTPESENVPDRPWGWQRTLGLTRSTTALEIRMPGISKVGFSHVNHKQSIGECLHQEICFHQRLNKLAFFWCDMTMVWNRILLVWYDLGLKLLRRGEIQMEAPESMTNWTWDMERFIA